MKFLLCCLALTLPAFADQVNCIKWKDSSGNTVGTYCKPFTIKAGSNVTLSDDQLNRVLTISSATTAVPIAGLYQVDGSTYPTIQSAITAAGTNGSVWIPGNYAGVDSYTNPNGIVIIDLRSQNFGLSALGVGANFNLATGQAFGMKCDGVTDDSAALVAAGKFSATVGRTVYIIPDASGNKCVIKTQALFAFAPTDTFVNGPRFECVSGATFDDQVANNSMILIMSTVPSKFVAHSLLQGCTIKTTTNPANSTGYELQRAWYSEIRGNRIIGLSGTGLKLTDLSADPGSTQINEIFQNEIISNAGDGITLVTTLGSPAVGSTVVRENRIAFNGGNGVTVNGARGTHFEYNTIGQNTGNGVEFTASSGCNSITASIIGGSFDTNGLTGSGKGHIAYDCGINLTVMGVEFDHSVVGSGCGVTNAACHTEFDIKSGDGVNAGNGLTATGNYHRLDDTTTPANYYNLTSTSSKSVISQAIFDRVLAAGQNKYADASVSPQQDKCFEQGQNISCDSVTPGRAFMFMGSTAGAASQLQITGPDGTHASSITDTGVGLALVASGTGHISLTPVDYIDAVIGIFRLREATAPGGVANSDFLYADSTAHRLKMNNNNGGAVQVVASGVDINTSDQVTVTHLASALPVNQGGTAQTVASTFPSTAGAIPEGFSCGTTSTCANTAQGNTLRIFFGSAPLVSASPSTVTVSGISPAFTSSSSYFCVVTNATTQANPLKVVNVSSSSFIITGPNTVTDTANYQCVGN